MDRAASGVPRLLRARSQRWRVASPLYCVQWTICSRNGVSWSFVFGASCIRCWGVNTLRDRIRPRSSPKAASRSTFPRHGLSRVDLSSIGIPCLCALRQGHTGYWFQCRGSDVGVRRCIWMWVAYWAGACWIFGPWRGLWVRGKRVYRSF